MNIRLPISYKRASIEKGAVISQTTTGWLRNSEASEFELADLGDKTPALPLHGALSEVIMVVIVNSL